MLTPVMSKFKFWVWWHHQLSADLFIFFRGFNLRRQRPIRVDYVALKSVKALRIYGLRNQTLRN